MNERALEIVENKMKQFQKEKDRLANDIAERCTEYWPSGAARKEPVSQRMAVIIAKISVCEELIHELTR